MSGPLKGSSEWTLHRSALIVSMHGCTLSHQHQHMQSVFISIDIIVLLTGGGGSLTNASYLSAQHALIRKLTILVECESILLSSILMFLVETDFSAESGRHSIHTKPERLGFAFWTSSLSGRSKPKDILAAEALEKFNPGSSSWSVRMYCNIWRWWCVYWGNYRSQSTVLAPPLTVRRVIICRFGSQCQST